MRFDRIRIAHFGRLAGFDTGDDALPALVVVHGRNEAGKSTLFRFLASLLYGFYPATRDGHPYAPWSGDDIDGEAEIRLASGESVRVRRRLLSAPWARLYRDGAEEDLRNNALPWAASVQQAVFEQVYALRLADLARLRDDAWHQVQDRLLGGMGTEDLRPAREVADDLEREAAALWRPDRRGSPRARELQDELGELRRSRAEAVARDAEIRGLSGELAGLAAELDSLGKERLELEVAIERVTVLLPVRQHLARIHELQAAAGDTAELDGLPDSPRAELETLEESADRLGGELKEREAWRDRLEATAGAFTSVDAAVLAHAPTIRELFMRAGEMREAAARLASFEARIARLESGCEARARELFTVGWRELDRQRIRTAPLGELRERVRRCREAADELGRREAELAALRAVPATGTALGPLPGGPTLLAMAAALALAGLVLGVSALVTLAIVSAALGAAQLLAKRVGTGGARAEALRRARRERDEAARAGADLAIEVAHALEGLPVAPALLERPGPELVQAFEALLDRLADLDAVSADAQDLSRRIASAEERIRSVGAALGRTLPDDFVAATLVLDSALRDAEARERAAATARTELHELERTEPGLRERHQDVLARLRALRERLARLGGGDVGQGTDAAETRLAHRRRARELGDELERRHPDLQELERRIREAEDRAEEWTRDDHAHVRARQRVKRLDERERELIGELKDRQHELRRLESLPALDHVEGEIEAVRNELAEVCRERDRKVLLARLVRRADTRFRETNQPDLLRRAGAHLARITGGRYERLELPDDAADGSLLLHAAARPEPLEVAEPVSNGTRDQVYLALRLAIIDHLDANGEPLPLFADEAFVNWDSVRLERGAELLGELSRERQVFVFTCHDAIAAALQARGARVLRMPAPD